jgi:hypothetical protein
MIVVHADQRGVVDDGATQRAVRLHDVGHAYENHTSWVRYRLDLENVACEPALTLRLVRHLYLTLPFSM